MSIRKSTRVKRVIEQEIVPVATPAPKRVKADPKPAPDSLEFILTNPKSKLCSLDISAIFNEQTWSMLSPEVQDRLIKLLPPTSFQSYTSKPEATRPSVVYKLDEDKEDDWVDEEGYDAMEVDVDEGAATGFVRRREDLVPGFMNCDYLQAAAQQFQDQVYSGYFTTKHIERVALYQEETFHGAAHAPWKDEEWEADHRSDSDGEPRPTTAKGKEKARKKLVLLPTLPDLVAADLLRQGDLLVYKRTFANPRYTVQKHLILQSVDHHRDALTFLLPSSTTISFNQDVLSYPAEILYTIPSTSLTPSLTSSRRITLENFDDFPSAPGPSSAPTPDPEYHTITTSTSSVALESHLLPLYDQIRAEDIHQTDTASAKCFTVWRWRDEDAYMGGDYDAPLGGREGAGTLHYLFQNCPK